MGLHCIRFGEIVLDENFRTFLLCNRCKAEFLDVPDFREHLDTSVCGEPFFRESVLTLKFGAPSTKRANGQKQYLIYNPVEVQVTTSSAAPPKSIIQETAVNNKVEPTARDSAAAERDYTYFDLLKIEEELLDPRWYTDITTPADAVSNAATMATSTAAPSSKLLEYKDLVEAVGPYVQFKENVKQTKVCNATALKRAQETSLLKANIRKPVAAEESVKTVLNPAVQTGARLLNPTAKRKLSLPPKQTVSNETKANQAKPTPTTLTPPKVLNDNQLLKSQNCNKRTQQTHISKTATTADLPSPKRRKMLTIPMTQVHIHPEFQEQFGGSNAPLKTYSKQAKTNVAPKDQQQQQQQKNKAPAKSSLAPNPAAVSVIAKAGNTQPRSKKNVASVIQQPGRKKKPVANAPASKVAGAAQSTETAPSEAVILSPVVVQNKPVPPTLNAVQQSDNAPARVQETAAILNKLQTLGLQVKRTQPPNQAAAIAATAPAASNNNTKMLELVKKLQSKGMNVKIVNGKQQLQAQTQTQTQTQTQVQAKARKQTSAAHHAATQVTSTNTTNVDLTISPENAARKQHLNGAAIASPSARKTVLNSTVIIKKVK